jgi:hypothetical protein|tara:strand:- start:354 stop:557 length:204 start_codon:yes stop_codon:yes gene_type:complete
MKFGSFSAVTTRGVKTRQEKSRQQINKARFIVLAFMIFTGKSITVVEYSNLEKIFTDTLAYFQGYQY